MKQVTKQLRGAYMSLLSGMTYNGVVIPVKSGMTNGKGAIIDVTGCRFEAFINIINPYRNTNLIKNGMNHNVSLTVDINTVFHGDSFNFAGDEWVEDITDVFFDRVFDNETFILREFGMNDDRFIVTGTSFFGQPMPLQYNASSRSCRSVIVFEHTIHHLKTEDVNPDLWIKTIYDGV